MFDDPSGHYSTNPRSAEYKSGNNSIVPSSTNPRSHNNTNLSNCNSSEIEDMRNTYIGKIMVEAINSCDAVVDCDALYETLSQYTLEELPYVTVGTVEPPSYGERFINKLGENSSLFLIAGGISQVDSPAPGPMDAIGALFALTVLAVTAITAIPAADAPSIPLPSIPILEIKEKDETDEAIGDIVISSTNERNTPTIIYRYGGTNPGNLIPTVRDVELNSGLSFSTTYRKGAAMTTIEAVNATGVLKAVKDGPTHVTVYPIGGTVDEWHEQGADSIWTKTLKSIVTKAELF